MNSNIKPIYFYRLPIGRLGNIFFGWSFVYHGYIYGGDLVINLFEIAEKDIFNSIVEAIKSISIECEHSYKNLMAITPTGNKTEADMIALLNKDHIYYTHCLDELLPHLAANRAAPDMVIRALADKFNGAEKLGVIQ